MHINDFEIANLPKGQKLFEWLDVASRPDGGEWRIPLLSITGNEDGPTFVVIAGIHGDEYEGPETIARVYQQIRHEDIRGKLVMVPFFNLPAYEAGTRTSPVDGLNLARVMPGDPNGSISYRLGYYVTEKFIMPSDLFLDIHSGGVALNICTSIYYYHTDNEIGRKTQAAAEAFAAPAVIGSTNPGAAVYGCSFRTCWDRGKAGMFTEAHGAGRTLPHEIDYFTTGVINVMKHLGMLQGEPTPQRVTHHLVSDDKPGGSFSASIAGYFLPEVKMLEHVTTGQKLGVVQDFSGATLEEFHAGRDGYITMLRGVPRVNVGDALFGITDGTCYLL
jgi:N-alpha-acetyl-L-2,4-diaminobutyrate deacetylase